MDGTVKLTDSHAHLYEMEKKSPGCCKDLLDASSSFGGRIMDIGIHLGDLEERLGFLSSLGGFPFSIGLYPSIAREAGMDGLFEKLSQLLESWPYTTPRPSGIGETGIDWFHDYGPRQSELFRKQVRLSLEYQLPLIVHSREADMDVYQALLEENNCYKGVMHCWSGSIEAIARYQNLGFHISFAGNITYKKNNILRDCIQVVDRDRLLIESDAPYLSPEPFRSTMNSPLYTLHTLTKCSEVLGESTESLGEQIADNFCSLFGYPARW